MSERDELEVRMSELAVLAMTRERDGLSSDRQRTEWRELFERWQQLPADEPPPP